MKLKSLPLGGDFLFLALLVDRVIVVLQKIPERTLG
jgi:hypothetical protein